MFAASQKHKYLFFMSRKKCRYFRIIIKAKLLILKTYDCHNWASYTLRILIFPFQFRDHQPRNPSYAKSVKKLRLEIKFMAPRVKDTAVLSRLRETNNSRDVRSLARTPRGDFKWFRTWAFLFLCDISLWYIINRQKISCCLAAGRAIIAAWRSASLRSFCLCYPASIAIARERGTFRFPRERPGGNRVKVTRTGPAHPRFPRSIRQRWSFEEGEGRHCDELAVRRGRAREDRA